MARMTPAEANAVNVVCTYLSAKEEQLPPEVARSLAVLASRAYNRIQTGWHESTVFERWPDAFKQASP
jgi:hypothetical protein